MIRYVKEESQDRSRGVAVVASLCARVDINAPLDQCVRPQSRWLVDFSHPVANAATCHNSQERLRKSSKACTQVRR